MESTQSHYGLTFFGLLILSFLIVCLTGCTTSPDQIYKNPERYRGEVRVRALVKDVISIPGTSYSISRLKGTDRNLLMLSNQSLRPGKTQSFRGRLVVIGSETGTEAVLESVDDLKQALIDYTQIPDGLLLNTIHQTLHNFISRVGMIGQRAYLFIVSD
jgi:hypothetical protein